MQTKLQQLLKKQKNTYRSNNYRITNKLLTFLFLNQKKTQIQYFTYQKNVKFIVYFIITKSTNQIYYKYTFDKKQIFQHERIAYYFGINQKDYISFIYIHYLDQQKQSKQYDIIIYNDYGRLQYAQKLHAEAYWKNFSLIHQLHYYFTQNYQKQTSQTDNIYFKYEIDS